MSKKIDKRIKVEYDRIAAGPRTGWFTLLHHEGPELENSHNVIERLNFILSDKPEHERLCRLINIIWVSEEKADDYNAKCKLLDDDDYNAKCKLLTDDYNAKRKPLDDDYYSKRKALDDDYNAKRKPLTDDYNAKRKALTDDYNAKRIALDDDYYSKRKALLKRLHPRTTWNGKTIFGKVSSATGS